MFALNLPLYSNFNQLSIFPMYLQKRTYSYYFRMPIPTKPRQAYGKSEICFSLNTLNRTDAKLKALEYIRQYLLDFEQKKALPLPVRDAPVPSPAASPIVRTASPDKVADGSLSTGNTFSVVYRKYLAERKPRESTIKEYETVVRRFTAICC